MSEKLLFEETYRVQGSVMLDCETNERMLMLAAPTEILRAAYRSAKSRAWSKPGCSESIPNSHAEPALELAPQELIFGTPISICRHLRLQPLLHTKAVLCGIIAFIACVLQGQQALRIFRHQGRE